MQSPSMFIVIPWVFAQAPPYRKVDIMLYYTVVFFVIALIAAFFGFSGIAAGAAEIAKILFFVFLVITIISILVGVFK